MAGQNYISKINGAGISASYALTASYAMNGGGGAAFPYVGTAVITGSLIVSGSPSTSSFNGLFQVKDSTGASVIISNTNTRSLYDNSNKLSIDFITRELTDNTPSTSLNWFTRVLYDGQTPPTLSLDWSSRQLYYPNGTSAINYGSNNSVTITGVTTSTLGFTGSLFGTASQATNALTASFLNTLNQNLIISGNIIPAGPYTNNTSSYSLGSPTAAWKDLYVSNGSVTLIDGVSSASMQFNNGTVTFTGASVTLPSNSISPTASFALAASGSLTGSLFGTASWAQSASQAINAQTASFLLGSVTSASYAGTASKVIGGTTNYVPLWTTGTTLGSSVLYQSSNNIGLGTTSPNTVLHISASSAQPLLNIENSVTNGYSNMRFTGTGQKFIIGVGNASETTFSLANKFFLYDDTSGTVRLTTDSSGLFSLFGSMTSSGNINGASPTEMSYLSGVTSAIQTQLNSKVAQDSISLINNVSVTIGTSTTSYISFCAFTTNSVEAARQVIIPVSGLIKNLYVLTSTTQSAGGSLVCTVRKNGVNTALATTIAAGTAAGTFSDLVDSVSVAAGDRLSLQVQNNAATGTAAQIVSVAIIIERS